MSAAFRWMALISTTATVLAAASSVQALGPRRSAVTPESDSPRVYRVVNAAPSARYAVSTPRVIAVPPVAPAPPVAPEPGLAPLAALARLRYLPNSGWFGVSLRCGDCSIRRAEHDSVRALEWRFRSEPEILGVEPGSPADHAGIEEGDIITHVAGIDITSRDGGRRFGATKPGDEVEWTIERDGKTRVVKLKAAARPDDDDEDDQAGQEALRDARRELERARIRLRSSDKVSDRDARAYDETVTRAIERAEKRLEAVQRRLENYYGENTLPPNYLEAQADAERQAELEARSARTRRVRYRGDIGTSHVEVRGSSRVVVTEDGNGGLVIDTPDASIHIDKKR